MGHLAYLPGRLRPATLPGAFLELPNQHRIPLTWLLENAGPSIRYRSYTELAPEGYASPEVISAAHVAVVESKTALAVVKRQKDTGVWGGNLLGLAPSAPQGIKFRRPDSDELQAHHRRRQGRVADQTAHTTSRPRAHRPTDRAIDRL